MHIGDTRVREGRGAERAATQDTSTRLPPSLHRHTHIPPPRGRAVAFHQGERYAVEPRTWLGRERTGIIAPFAVSRFAPKAIRAAHKNYVYELRMVSPGGGGAPRHGCSVNDARGGNTR
jgi:hypothetical protein